jgi:hypothetical protein
VERFTTAEWAIRGVQSELEARVPVEERSLFRRVLSSLR